MNRYFVVLVASVVVLMMIFPVTQVHAGNIFTRAGHKAKVSKRIHKEVHIPIPPAVPPYDDDYAMCIQKISVRDPYTGKRLWSAGRAKGTFTRYPDHPQSIYVYAAASGLQVGRCYEVRFMDRQKRSYCGWYEVTEINGITGFKFAPPRTSLPFSMT